MLPSAGLGLLVGARERGRKLSISVDLEGPKVLVSSYEREGGK